MANLGFSPIPIDSEFSLIEGMVGRAHQRASFHVFEAHSFAEEFVFGEFIGMNVPNDG